MTGQKVRQRVGWVVVAALFPLLQSCESVPAGPSLSNVTFTPNVTTVAGWKASQRPTIKGLSGAPDPAVCCCHVTGTVRNSNNVPAHVVITFAAMDPSNNVIGEIVYFEKDLQAGASDSIEAPGFLFSCASIDHVDYQLNVSSLGPPIL